MKSLYQFLYGAFFCVILPCWLVLWAYLTRDAIPVNLEGSRTQILGGCITLVGLLLQLLAMKQLWQKGKGLPMNAFPPQHYVTSGVYQYLRHPIYVGFILTCSGFSLLCLSASGLFFITPIMALLCVSLVLGYEQPAIAARFGKKQTEAHAPLFGPPLNTQDWTDLKTRLTIMFIVFVFWTLLYYWLIYLGDSPHFFTLALPGEEQWPVFQWSEFFYALTYPFVLTIPLVLKQKDMLREFVHTAGWLIAWGIFLQYTLPIHAPPRPFQSDSFLGDLLLWERGLDGPVCAFPSFHVMWALAGASFWSLAFPLLRLLWWTLATLMSLSCITTGNHTVADVIAGVVVFLLVDQRHRLWSWLQTLSERLANSWRAWQFGPLRVINHSLYAGLACTVGILLAGQFIPELTILFLVTFLILISACLWGQSVTGSSKLLRPFGYYGAILGAILAACIIVNVWSYSWLALCGIMALAAPWVQAIGRLRCLVQGCCHGKPTHSIPGIRCANPHSRICAVSNLQGLMIHNTQLYSIITNIVTGMLLWRLWYADLSPALLAGLYGILNGAFRFIEERYRGEAQTPSFGGLRLYQWLSLASIVAGMIITCLPGPQSLVAHWRFDIGLLATSITCGFFAAFMMGMDFPQSNQRFARLSG
ncbi:MAG TPA: prolipoprotein diacylglyceryl transferase [Gemmatales bacterium]|nr:prolipoprotein diacylglyceryl transferase [Gemmatales bacterium]